MTETSFPEDSPSDSTQTGIFGLLSRAKEAVAQEPHAVSRYMFVAAAVVVLLGGVMYARIIIAPVFMALFIAVILAPSLGWLKSKGLSEILSIIVLTLGVSAVTCGIGWIVFISAAQFKERVPEYSRKIDSTIKRFEDIVDGLGFMSDEDHKPKKPEESAEPKLEPASDEGSASKAETNAIPEHSVNEISGNPGLAVPEYEQLAFLHKILVGGEEFQPEQDPPTLKDEPLEPGGEDSESVNDGSILETKEGRLKINSATVIAYARSFASETMRLVTVSFIIVLLAIFMLIEAAIFPKKFAAAFGEWNITNEHLSRIARDIRQYMVLKGFISLIVGVCATVLNWALGIEYAMLWGLLAFFLNFIPNIGSIVAAIPPVLLAMVDFIDEPILVVLVTLGYLFINCFMGYIVEPQWLGQGLGISPLVVLLSLLFWGFILGPIGMFLAAPLSVVIKIILQTFDETRWVSVMMDDKVRE